MSSRVQVAGRFDISESLLRQLERRGVLPRFGSLCPSGYEAAVRLYLGSRRAGTSAKKLTEALSQYGEVA